MKKILLTLLLMTFVFSLAAQSKGKRFDVEAIKSDTTYYWGENSVVDSDDKALELAIDNMLHNIVNNCNPNALYVGTKDQKTQLYYIVSTFLFKIHEKVAQHPLISDFEDEEYSYFVYMKKSDFREMCNVRKNNIERLAHRGYNNENDENLQLEDALKSYYWGMMLCVAHPYGNNLKINIEEEDVVAYSWFKDRIDDVLASFNFRIPKENAFIEKDDGVMVELNVSSNKGMSVSNLQFEYYNGQKYVPSSVHDGKAVLFLKNFDKPQLNIKIEYEFLMESTVDPDVNKVLHSIDHNLKFNNKRVIDISKYIDNVVKEEDLLTGQLLEPSEVESMSQNVIDKSFNVESADYLDIMREVEMAFRKKDYRSVRHHFTNEGFGMIDTLSRYGKMTVVGQQDYVFLKLGDKVICRDINMQFDFRNHASFNRDVVFRFDSKSQKIESVAFRLSSITERDIVSKTKWPEESRMVLINFLEDYQTAYALKRLDYLESIYSDDALIIVGHVVKKTVISDRVKFNLADKEIELMNYDKNTYFKNLSRTFKSQEYINLRFAETDFTRAPSSSGREIYGVRLLQEYYSSTYGDIGYLFLLVDLTTDKPLIHVRAWQPDEVELSKLMGMKDLRF